MFLSHGSYSPTLLLCPPLDPFSFSLSQIIYTLFCIYHRIHVSILLTKMHETDQATTSSLPSSSERSSSSAFHLDVKQVQDRRAMRRQARERKKAYLNDLETGVKDLEKKNTELEERLSTLQNENQMLRHILKNTTASRRGGNGGANEGTL